MKLSKTMKKIWTYVCVITMVVSSLTFYNDTYVRAAAPDWSGVAYAGDGVGGGSYANKYKFYCEDSRVNLVNIQKPGFATADSFYVTFPAGIESSSLGEGKYDPQGAGIAIHLDAFTAQETEFTVTDALGTYTCYVYYEDGEGSEVATPAPTEPVEVTDGAEILNGTKFTDADTEADPGPNGLWIEFGGEYTNNGDGSVSVAVPAYESGDNWATQLKQNQIQLNAGKWYKATYTITSDVDKTFQGMVQNNSNWAVYAENITKVAAGETKTVEFVFQATATTNTVLFGIMMGYVSEPSEAANVTISNVSLKVYNEEPSTGETKPDTTEPAPVEKGDIALSGYNWAIQTPDTEGFATSEYNGYGFTVQGIAANAEQWSYGALLDAIAVTNGETYTLTLNVKSTVNKVVPIEFTNGTAINRTIAATPEGTVFTYKFTAKADTVKIYMPLGINGDDVEITDAYDIIISDVQFDVTEPDETEPMTTLPADAEVTILEPTFAFDNSTSTKYYELHWNAVEGAATYTAYVDVEDEDHIATAYHNNWPFNKTGQTHVDHIAGKPGQTQKFIVVAFDEEGKLLARGIKEVTTPELTEEEKAAAAVAAKFNSEDNYAKGATAIVSSGSNAQNIVDGNMASRWQASTAGEDHAVGSEFFGVNLGEVKTIGQVVIAFEASYAAAYDVYVAGADEVYSDTPVATGTADATNLISAVNFDEVEAQYVKVVVTEFSTNANAYGTSVFELAVLPKAEEVTTPETTPAPTEPDTTPVAAEKPAAPTGLAHTPGADGTLPFHFAWGAVEGATSYKVYLNDEYVAEVTTQDYNFDETLFAVAGDYTIAVTAVKDGIESDKAAINYTVQGAETTPAQTAPAEIIMDMELPAPESDNNYTVGGYNVYVGQWNGSTAIAGVDANDQDHVKVQQKTSNWVEGGAWGVQVVKDFTGLSANTEYTIEWKIVSASTDGKVLVTNNSNEIMLTGGEQILSGTFTADADGKGQFVVGMGWVGLENPIEYFAPVVKDADGNVVYPKDDVETTTPADVETTTPADVETTTP
ncbi:MAG: discoidin domain-containing protein, partial [Eubacterium sp.]|nr:discoidin domain-containing protein [Eubacterium sp.]